jgi:UDP-arabinose 4-epimerase
MKVFITGGAGYVGSHCCKAFAQKGWEVVVYDNLSRGSRQAVRWGTLIEGDVLDRDALFKTIAEHRPDFIAHFAAVISATASVVDPAIYYRTNSIGTLNVLDAMRETGTLRLLFSSTSAVYGASCESSVDETCSPCPINAYGRSKFAAELMIEDYSAAYGLHSVILRYFNAAGFDPEIPTAERFGTDASAIQLAVAAALGDAPFQVFGTDFGTRDGTAVRDYVHVSDIADAHIRAAEFSVTARGANVFNLGTEHGTSVFELLRAVNRVSGLSVPSQNENRRPGEPASVVASAAKAARMLGWRPTRSSIDEIVGSTLDWRRVKD